MEVRVGPRRPSSLGTPPGKDPGPWTLVRNDSRPFVGGGRLALLHWTSADAVLVVTAYAWALARGAGTTLPWPVYGFLALGIWLGYTADRLADLEKSPSRAQRTRRHAFHLRHQTVLTMAWMGGFLAALPLAWALLPYPAILAGCGLGAGAAIYVWWGSGTCLSSVRRPSGRGRWKRRCTTLLLSTAGMWSLWAGGGDFSLPVGVLVGIFAVGAWWNLTLLGYQRSSPAHARTRQRLPGRPQDSILAATLLLVLPLWSGTFSLLPGVAVLVLGLGGLAWHGTILTDDALALAADGTLCLGLLAMGLAMGPAVG